MDISPRLLTRRLAPRHWLAGHLVVFGTDDASEDEDKFDRSATRVVATVTCREHFCVSLNGKWQAYYSPNGTLNVVRDNSVLTATLQRVDPVIRIDYVDGETGAVWFCTQSDTWRRWIWAWNHGVKTVTQVNLIRGPDVTEEYKQRVFTALEDLDKSVSVYAYRKAPGEYWIHNDTSKPHDMHIDFEPMWYDLKTRSFMSLIDTDEEDDEKEEEEEEQASTETERKTEPEEDSAVLINDEEGEEEEEEPQALKKETSLSAVETDDVEEAEEQEEEEEEAEEDSLPA